MNRGEVYLAPFPYADLQGSKRRPVCVVSSAAYNRVGDPIVVMVTSSRARLASPGFGDAEISDWRAGGLLRPSAVRAGKLFAVESRLLVGARGTLARPDLDAVDRALRSVLGLT